MRTYAIILSESARAQSELAFSISVRAFIYQFETSDRRKARKFVRGLRKHGIVARFTSVR